MHGHALPEAKGLSWGRARALASAWPVLLIAGITFATRAPYFGDLAPSFDEQLYNLIGHHMLSGSVPYVDLWDRKPIGLFLIFAFANAAAAFFGISGTLAYEILAACFTLGGALLTWRLATRISPGFAAVAAGAIYPLLLGARGAAAGQSEAFYVPMMLGVLALVEHGMKAPDQQRMLRSFAIAMALGGLALQVKYTVAPQCAFLGLVALWCLYRRGMDVSRVALAAVAFGALGLLPTAVAWLAYWSMGYAGDFVFANFVSIFSRRAPRGSRLMSLLPYFSTLAIFTLGGLATLLDQRNRPSSIYLLYAGWAASCVLGLFMGSTIYGYYFAALVPGALLVGVPLLSLGGPALLTLLLAAMLLSYDVPGRIKASQHARAALAKLTELIEPHVGPGKGCLYVYDGPSALYDTTRSCLPTRFIYPDHLNNALETKALGIDQAGEVRRVFANRPGAVVTADHAVTVQNPASGEVLKEELERGYRALAAVRFNGRILTVHVRKDDALRPASLSR